MPLKHCQLCRVISRKLGAVAAILGTAIGIAGPVGRRPRARWTAGFYIVSGEAGAGLVAETGEVAEPETPAPAAAHCPGALPLLPFVGGPSSMRLLFPACRLQKPSPVWVTVGLCRRPRPGFRAATRLARDYEIGSKSVKVLVVAVDGRSYLRLIEN